MHTDKVPRSAEKQAEYKRSDALRRLELPSPDGLRVESLKLKEALQNDDRKGVQLACNLMIKLLAEHYKVSTPTVRVLAARPQRASGDWVFETFGDYQPESLRIRLWMRTAVQKKATSYGVLLNTFCHEFCHHLDMVSLDLPNTYHTRGFFERTAMLYHHIQNTPTRPIVWRPLRDGTYQVDWGKTMGRTTRL